MQDANFFLPLQQNDDDDDDDRSQETSKRISPTITEKRNHTTMLRSSSSSSCQEKESDQLGLSLRIQSNTTNQQEVREEEQADHQEDNMIIKEDDCMKQNKIQRTEITSHVASPPNRKARVSVRARCETATVSVTSSLIYTLSIRVQIFCTTLMCQF